jgi:hypothetical protein
MDATRARPHKLLWLGAILPVLLVIGLSNATRSSPVERAARKTLKSSLESKGETYRSSDYVVTKMDHQFVCAWQVVFTNVASIPREKIAMIVPNERVDAPFDLLQKAKKWVSGWL